MHAEVRSLFPILDRKVNGRPLTYLDSAATTQRPLPVLDAMRDFDLSHNANIHRGVHTLSVEATEFYEHARKRVAQGLHASRPEEIVFTRGTTEAINLVANTLPLEEGDEILLSEMEHHSNIVPWQLRAVRDGVVVRPYRVTPQGEVDLDALRSMLSERTRVVGIVHVSNALGTVNPVKEIARLAHEVGATVVVDGAQAMPHERVDVRDLDADFYAISGHKMYGPTGIGALYGKFDRLTPLMPWQGGGEMISSVSFQGTSFNRVPARFEAGTPNFSGAVGLAAAFDLLDRIGIDAIREHEAALLAYATEALGSIPGLTIVGTARHKASVVSFTLDGIHPHDIGTILDQEGVAVRTGHHCTEPLMRALGIDSTARASMGVYNTTDDIDRLVEGIASVQRIFGVT
ncbi:MAG: cysteine desulfurase, partial [Phycisphaerales bacterium]|nr:cysteine desulfurase [Phycisphaerales bacterium]